MKNSTSSIFLILFLLFINCSNDDMLAGEASEKLIGTWRTFAMTSKTTGLSHSDFENGIVVEWGNWYIMDFELIDNGTLNLKTGNFGKWKLNEGKSVLLIEDNDTEKIVREFQISFNKEGYLILEDDQQVLKHKRIN